MQPAKKKGASKKKKQSKAQQPPSHGATAGASIAEELLVEKGAGILDEAGQQQEQILGESFEQFRESVEVSAEDLQSFVDIVIRCEPSPLAVNLILQEDGGYDLFISKVDDWERVTALFAQTAEEMCGQDDHQCVEQVKKERADVAGQGIEASRRIHEVAFLNIAADDPLFELLEQRPSNSAARASSQERAVFLNSHIMLKTVVVNCKDC